MPLEGVEVIRSLDADVKGPMTPDCKQLIRKDIYQELIDSGELFAHAHRGMDRVLMQLDGAMTTQTRSGWRVSTNSGAILRKAGRLDAADHQGGWPRSL